ncbi:MAG: hypothetical protein ACQEVA_13630 [Myxococcota bacterium]
MAPDMQKPRFDALEDALGGVWATARMAWSVNNVERAIEREEWIRALDALEKIAARMQDESVSRLAWRELLEGALWLAPRNRNWRSVIDLVEAHAERAWSDERRRQMPWGVASTFTELDREAVRDEAAPTALRLGRVLDRAFPRCPLGAYALGHFRADVDKSVGHFERAAQLFDALELDELAAHARTRAGSAALLSGTDAMRGRRMLQSARGDLSKREDLLWWSLGTSRSDKWIDRVRAADALLDLYAKRERDDEEFPEDLGHAVIWMVGQAPMQLQSTERDRLESLVEVGLPDEASAPMLSQLEQRDAMAALLARPADELRDALDLRGGPEDDPRDQFYSAVASLEDPDLYGRPDTDAFCDELPVAAAVVDVLSAIRRDNPQSVATNSGLLEKVFRDGLADDAQLGALSLLWPEALAYLDVLKADEDVDATTVKRIRASLAEVAGRALTPAPTPSYGWWSLAANFMARGMRDAATTCTERAIRSGESVDDALEAEVLALVLDHVIASEIGEEELVWWLEHGEQRLRER